MVLFILFISVIINNTMTILLKFSIDLILNPQKSACNFLKYLPNV